MENKNKSKSTPDIVVSSFRYSVDGVSIICEVDSVK